MNKNMMCAAVMVTSLVLAGNVFGASGYFNNAYVVINDGTGNTFHQITQPANDLLNANQGFNLTPDGVNPSFSVNLGEFDLSTDSLILNGFEINTFNADGDNITNAILWYRVTKDGDTPGSFSSIELTSPNSISGNDKFWQITNANSNLLSGLDIGDYSLDVYFRHNATFTGGGGGTFEMGNWSPSNNPTATFTVIPEPSSIIMMGLAGLAAGGLTVLKRRKRA
ncbi:MAG: PEP-CTERM sorting domain-containing protein [Verrucomicrobia bacterium]|nr:PEP-CTERM sorting domain-containing protein [Verrucomicrobiota bacterium]MCH8528784.1 PEP-CTERM sorting domain-containing protein [Kiritimatiellia bacterium]